MTLINLQDKLVAAELAAIAKHGRSTATARKVMFSARTRFKNAVIAMGFDERQARDFAYDAADMTVLILNADGGKR